MCSDPKEKDGKIFACRNCDECISNRRHQWEARAMMERHLHPHCLCLGLTYDDETEHNRDAAQFFQYLDVRRFFARIRETIASKNLDPRIRFVVAGEQGDRNGRVHWHMIIYSQVDLTQFGEIKRMLGGKKQVVTDRKLMISQHGRKPIRLNWSLWGHGFVTFQEPDQGGMHYVLSYCLADQFTEEKSKGTGRQAKAANFSTGLFRMSKRPPIGAAWLWQKFASLEEKGALLPELKFQIPGFHGYYVPSGSVREACLWSLRAINQRVKWATGQDAPQWSTLLASLQDFPSETEILLGPQQEDRDNVESVETVIAREQREQGYQATLRDHRRKCGHSLPCEECLSQTPQAALASLGVERYEEFRAILHRSLPGFAPVHTRQTDKAHFVGKSNRWCLLRGSKISRHAFPESDQTRLDRSNL